MTEEAYGRILEKGDVVLRRKHKEILVAGLLIMMAALIVILFAVLYIGGWL